MVLRLGDKPRGVRGRLNKSSADLFTLDLPRRRELGLRSSPPRQTECRFSWARGRFEDQHGGGSTPGEPAPGNADEEHGSQGLAEIEEIAGLRWSDEVSHRLAINNQPGDQLFNSRLRPS